jgi:hypothetical protein
MNKSLLRLTLFGSVCAAAATISPTSACTVTTTSPANGAVVTSPVTVNAQVDPTTCNSGFNHLQVLVNGNITYQGSCEISAPISVPPGSDALTVQAIAWNGALLAQSTITIMTGQPGNGAQLYVSTLGSDANPGTAQSPFRTIGRAARAATAGTTVYVEPGTYVGDVYVTAPGVTYRSVVKWGAVLVPPATSSTATGFWKTTPRT